MVFGVVLIAKHWKKLSLVNSKKDGDVIFAVPVILRLYNMIVSAGHCYLLYVFRSETAA